MAEEVKKEIVTPGIRFDETFRKKLLDAGLSEEQIKILEAIDHVFFGHIIVHKKEGKISGRIELKSTY